jgi:glycosyltransferase involved in cell wall biosynthesis
MSDRSISVIIPAFNAGMFLRAALESVIAQSGVSTEIVVIDDGSTDDTAAVARGFGERVQLFEGEHKGAQTARNTGLASTRAPFVKFLDADDVLLPGSLERQLAQAAALDTRSIPYGPARTMDVCGKAGGVLPHTPPCSHLSPLAHMLFHSPLISGPLHRRELIEEVGGLDESLPREHENDLHLRLALVGVSFRYDPVPVFAYRRHTTHRSLMAGGVTRFGSDWMLEYLLGVEQRLATRFLGAVPSDVRRHLAWYFWKCGRAHLREKETAAALGYFKHARRVFPEEPVFGRAPYRVLCSVFGPIHAERLLMAGRAPFSG